MSTLKVNSIEPTNAGSEDYFLARAWVNFNGTGTVAIRAGGNVSSITDYGTGNYGVDFTTALSSSDYAATRAVDYDSTLNSLLVTSTEVTSASTSQTRVTSTNSSGTAYDCLRVDLVITL